jgi:large subunit ribosomal protein L25
MSTSPTEILAVEPRTEFGTGPMRRLRRAGTLPGNLVNPKGDNVSIQMDAHTFDLIMLHHASEHLVMDVTLSGQKKKVVVREVQRHSLTENVLHVDFLEVAMDEKMKVSCMIEVVNDPVGVTMGGGVLEMLVREIEIECLPGDLVETIEVDVSGLEVGQSIHVSDLAMPAGLEAITAADVAVVTVMPPRVSEDTDDADSAEPEVIGKSKEDEDGSKG